jgi:hypothetical protein
LIIKLKYKNLSTLLKKNIYYLVKFNFSKIIIIFKNQIKIFLFLNIYIFVKDLNYDLFFFFFFTGKFAFLNYGDKNFLGLKALIEYFSL